MDGCQYLIKMILKDKKILITGGSRGIGKSVAAAFLKEGAYVMLVARSQTELLATQIELQKISQTVYIHAADVSNVSEVKAAVDETLKAFSGIDILVNAAGVYGPIGPSVSVDLDAWKKTFDVNLFGTFAMFQAVAPIMMVEKKGKIINFSGGGDGPLPNFSAYSSSKISIVRLTETLAQEMKPYGIDINAVAPGAVNTKILEDALAAGEALVGAERYKAILKQKEEGGVSPEKAAELCVFLASDASNGLPGKLVSAVWDDYKNWNAEKINELMGGPVLNMRRVNLPKS
jgi:NAD(P)-dependent dehydrogenase (short-subunit alcohol dehydrogenase family)